MKGPETEVQRMYKVCNNSDRVGQQISGITRSIPDAERRQWRLRKSLDKYTPVIFFIRHFLLYVQLLFCLQLEKG